MDSEKKTFSMFSSDEDPVEVKCFENFPFDDDHEVVATWRAGDLLDILLEEGKIASRVAKIRYVMLQKQYVVDDISEGFERGGELLKYREEKEYTVSVTEFLGGVTKGSIIRIEDLDQKIRDKKIDRII